LTELNARIEAAIGIEPMRLSPLHGGCVATVFKADIERRPPLVVKHAPAGGLLPEGFMLGHLSRETSLPVPTVRYEADDLLIMEFVAADGRGGTGAEVTAARQLAALHDRCAPEFGFECDTVIGGLPQPNAWDPDWCAFFRDRRLMFMGRTAFAAGNLPADTLRDLEALCGRLERYLGHDPRPALVHGDVWSGNVLYDGGQVAAYLDPAIYFADAEVELAFIELFSTFGSSFFKTYNDLRPIDPAYREVRRDIYNLYPLLVHSALFGGGYPSRVAAILRRYGRD
jgi:fructosamine-3-kinase